MTSDLQGNIAMVDDFPPGARRPETQPFRTPAKQPETLHARLARLEATARTVRSVVSDVGRQVDWLAGHWHQAIDRANEQLGDRRRDPLHPLWYWACGVLTGTGIGGLMLFALSRGWW